MKSLKILCAAAFFSSCAGQAVVAVKPGLNLKQISHVALLDFSDCSNSPGSGAIASQAFEPYLINAGYGLVERTQVEKVLQEKSFANTSVVGAQSAGAIGKLLGVDALILGSVTGCVDAMTETYMQNTQSMSYQPVYDTVQFKDANGNIRTRQDLAQYDVTTTNEQIPEVFTTPANLSVSARMVSVKNGEIFWTGSDVADGSSLQDAADTAAKKIMAALQKAIAAGGPH